MFPLRQPHPGPHNPRAASVSRPGQDSAMAEQTARAHALRKKHSPMPMPDKDMDGM